LIFDTDSVTSSPIFDSWQVRSRVGLERRRIRKWCQLH